MTWFFSVLFPCIFDLKMSSIFSITLLFFSSLSLYFSILLSFFLYSFSLSHHLSFSTPLHLTALLSPPFASCHLSFSPFCISLPFFLPLLHFATLLSISWLLFFLYLLQVATLLILLFISLPFYLPLFLSHQPFSPSFPSAFLSFFLHHSVLIPC